MLCGALWYTFGLADFAVAWLLGSKYRPLLFQLFAFKFSFIFSISSLPHYFTYNNVIDLLKLGFTICILLFIHYFFFHGHTFISTLFNVTFDLP